MRLVTFDDSGHARAGVLVGDQVVNLQRAEPRLPGDVLGLVTLCTTTIASGLIRDYATDGEWGLAKDYSQDYITLMA